MSVVSPIPSPGLNDQSGALVPQSPTLRLSKKERRKAKSKQNQQASEENNDQADLDATDTTAARLKFKKSNIKFPKGLPPAKSDTTNDHLDQDDHPEFGKQTPGPKGKAVAPPAADTDSNFLDASGNALTEEEIRAQDVTDTESAYENDPQDATERELMLQSGAQGNALARDRMVQGPRPKEIQAAWDKIYPLVRGWWTTKPADDGRLPKLAQDKIRPFDDSIHAYCRRMAQQDMEKNPGTYRSDLKALIAKYKQAGVLVGKKVVKDEENVREAAEKKLLDREEQKRYMLYKFPALWAHISAAQSVLNTIKHSEERGKMPSSSTSLREEKVSLVQGIATFTEILNRHQIPAKSVITPGALKKFESIVHESPELLRKYQETLAYLEAPTKDQEEMWALAVPQLETAIGILGNDMISEDMDNSWHEAIKTLEKRDDALKAINRKSKMEEEDHRLPIELLHDMWIQCTSQDHGLLEQSIDIFSRGIESLYLPPAMTKAIMAKINALSNTLPQARKALPPATYVESDDDDQIQKAVLESLQNSGGRGLRAGTSSTAGPSDQRSVSSDHQARGIRIMDQAARSKTPNALPSSRLKPSNSAGASNRLGGSVQSTRKQFTMEDIATLMQNVTTDVIQVPDYSDGKTEHGHLEASRIGRTDNARFARFILSAGSAHFPFHIVLRGSDLCPGGAEALAGIESKHVEFDLKTRKRNLRNNHSYIEQLGPCVIMPRSAEYAPRPGARTRRQDSYTRVKYRDEDKPEWLSRTELCDLIGKRYAEKTLLQLEDRYRNREIMMQACKQLGLYPNDVDGPRELDESDRSQYPWLFSDEWQPNFEANNGDDSDSSEVDMDDLDLDIQLAPETTFAVPTNNSNPPTNPFSKPRHDFRNFRRTIQSTSGEEL